MMRVIHIYPKQLSFLSSYNTMELLLYHEAKNSENYVEFFKQNNNYKILDNSFYELRKEIPYEELIEFGKEMHVNEIVLPDKLWDGNWTRNAVMDNLHNYYNTYRANGWKTSAVIQGKDEEDILETLQLFANNKRIDVLLVPRKLIKHETYFAGRVWFWLNHYIKFKKEVHFLGANSWGDFHIPISQRIRSMDTKLFAKTILHVLGKRTKWKSWDDVLLDEEEVKKANEITSFLKHSVQNYYGEV